MEKSDVSAIRSHFGSSPGPKPCQRGVALADFWVFVTMVESQWDVTTGLFEPNWLEVSTGSKVDVVLHITCMGTDSSLAKLVESGLPCRLFGALPSDCPSSYLTVFGALVLGVTPGVRIDLQLSPDSLFRPHPPATLPSLLRVVEFCSGIGASSIGLEKAGFGLVCGVEWRPALAKLFGRLHPDIKIVEGDINHSTTLQEVSRCVEGPFTLMAGISCQPYSRGGSQAGGADQRANTLPATCRACYLLGIPLLIIECVAPAGDNTWVRQHLIALQQRLGYQICEVDLKLEEVWAAHRHRWWMVASHPSLGIQGIRPFLQKSSLVVRDIMPYVREIPEDECDQLELKEDERQTFMDLAHGHMRKFCVRMDAKLPTALHSWGQQTQGCACGCRSGGFSLGLLQERGLFAQVLPLGFSEDNMPRWRHLQAMEVALLNGMPPSQSWGDDARLNLCAVGQLASPLQSVWVGAQIHKQLVEQLKGQTTIDPVVCLAELKKELLQQAKAMYPAIPAQMQPSLIKVLGESGGFSTISVSRDATVADFLAAEAKIDHEYAGWNVLDVHEQRHLSKDCTIAGRTLQLLPPTGTSQVSHLQVSLAIVDSEPLPTPVEPVETLSSESFLPADPPQHAVSSFVPSALLTLTDEKLTTLVPPQVQDPALMTAMRDQTMSVHDRQVILEHQKQVWGDDEIHWHLSRCVQSSVIGPVKVIDPLLATGWRVSSSVAAIQTYLHELGSFDFLVTCILIDHHWTPVVWRLHSQILQVHVWDHDDFDFRSLEAVHLAICKALGAVKFQVMSSARDFACASLCGPAAVAFIEHFVGKTELPHKESHLLAFHLSCRDLFKDHIRGKTCVFRPWCWGAGQSDLTGTLASLLGYHGVPEGVVQSRASLIMQCLGTDAVSKALQGTAPWKSLKSLANMHTPAIQLVLPDEQVAFQAKKTQQPNKQKKSKKFQPQPTSLKPADLDPSKLVLVEGSFCVAGDVSIPQISLSQVGPLSSGVALTTLAAASSFLKSGTLLTHQGLALLILNAAEEPVTSLSWSSVRFAAKCSLNHEPMLLTGFLVQLGKESVYLYKNKGGTPLMQVEVSCARITVYKDQWTGSWEDFHTKPVKACMAHFVALHSCLVDKCDCEKWHPDPNAAVHDAVLDVFRRQFFTEAGRPVDWANASYFAFMVRFVQTQEHGVLSVSGQNGIYVEPKTDDAGSPSLKYQVVWLPHLTFEEVAHRAQCEALSLGVARTGRRYGVRVAVEHFQLVFQALKPEGLFLPPGNRSTWHCGPWPFGVDRKAIAAVFKQWKWSARPLQPVHSVQGGMMWLIQAVADPPQVVFHMQHGQVVVSRRKQQEDPSVASEVIGQTQTVKLCASKTSEDPWVTKDPWQGYLPTTTPVSTGTHSKVQIDQMEARLEQAILAKLPATPMEQDDHTDRLNVLEQQVAQLTGRQQSLEHAVKENHSQSAAQVQQLQAQMTAQMDHQGRQMQSMLDDQMSKLEAILSKRSRHE